MALTSDEKTLIDYATDGMNILFSFLPKISFNYSSIQVT
jgi:hypothetical protein